MMSANARLIAMAWAGALCVLTLSCGGSSAPSNSVSATNVQAIVVNGGPNGNYANGLFTTVTVCAPGSANCQSISNVLVDSGSFGLRLLASALGTAGAALPQQKDGSGNSVYECAQFVDSVVWGPVKTADVKIGTETAGSIPIEVISSNTIPVPAACKALGPAEETVSTLGGTAYLASAFFCKTAEAHVRLPAHRIPASTTVALEVPAK
jgi:hypothetical protein